MKGEVGELKVLFDFAPQSRHHASLSTHTHTHTLVYMLTLSIKAKSPKQSLGMCVQLVK